jgi:hypothetical protein
MTQHVFEISKGAHSVSIKREVNGGFLEQAPLYFHNGTHYVEALYGHRYAISVRNNSTRRMEFVISVDGLDSLDGTDASSTKGGLVIPAYTSYDFQGFRTSMDTVAAYRFSPPEESYASQTGKPTNVGVIGVATYTEKTLPIVFPDFPIAPPRQPLPWPTRPIYPPHKITWTDNERKYNHGIQCSTKGLTSNASASLSRGGTRSGSAGTQFGETRHDHVGATEFTRSGAAAVVTTIRYEIASVLQSLGIVLNEDVHRVPNAFPGDPGREFCQPPRR